MSSHQVIQATRPAPSANYPVVESLIDLFARWLHHRREIAVLCTCDGAEYGLIARDLGVSPGELSELVAACVENSQHQLFAVVLMPRTSCRK